MGNGKVAFVYEDTSIELYMDNGNYCISVGNRTIADAVVCLPEAAFREFAEEFKAFYKSHYSKPGTKEERFRKWLRREVASGRIPGITECREWLGFQNNFNPKHGASLGVPYTRIRQQEFMRGGLVKHEETGRWQKPNKG